MFADFGIKPPRIKKPTENLTPTGRELNTSIREYPGGPPQRIVEYKTASGSTVWYPIESVSTVRHGNYMCLASGKRFYPLDPRVDEIDITDIAHALSMQCRFGGHVLDLYTVAQHSVLVSLYCEPQDALAGLLHDASEAYLQDVIRPIKSYLTGYKEYEQRLMNVIAQRFGLGETWQMPESVHVADEVILATEERDLMPPHEQWGLPYPPIRERIFAVQPWKAKQMFLDRFYELTGGVK